MPLDCNCSIDSDCSTSTGYFCDSNFPCSGQGDLWGVCVEESSDIIGCTDPTANNYNPDATSDDGSCTYESTDVYGCTDSEALNYNPDATITDGSCEYDPELVGECVVVWEDLNTWSAFMSGGCACTSHTTIFSVTSESECNSSLIESNINECTESHESGGAGMSHYSYHTYCPLILESYTDCDDTCSGYNTGGIISITFAEFNAVLGCTDPAASNYDSGATVDDGSCTYESTDVYGCTDPEASNYDSGATVDDESCTYESEDMPLNCNSDFDCPPLFSCIAGFCEPDESTPPPSEYPCCTTEPSYNAGASPWCSMRTAQLCSDVGGVTYSGFSTCGEAINAGYYWCGGEPPEQEPEMICVGNLTPCSDWNSIERDNYGDFIETGCSSGAPDYCTDAPDCHQSDCECVQISGMGCSSNQTEEECMSPCSWEVATPGCTDPSFDNYDSNANVNNGSCITYVYGCIDSTADNYDSNANVDDESCEYSCMGICGFPHPSEICSCEQGCIDSDDCCSDYSTSCIYGCTNSNADNYNPDATVDDGSCEIQENVVYVSDIPSFGISKDTFAISPVGADREEMFGNYWDGSPYLLYDRWTHLSEFYCDIGTIVSFRGFDTATTTDTNYQFGNTPDCIDCRPLDSSGLLLTDSGDIYTYYHDIRTQFSDVAWEMFQCICGWEMGYYGAEGISPMDSSCYDGCMQDHYAGYCGYTPDPEACFSAISSICTGQCTEEGPELSLNVNACDQFTNNYNKGGWIIENEVITQYKLIVINSDTEGEYLNLTFPYDRLAGDSSNILFKDFVSNGRSITFTELEEGNYTSTIIATTETGNTETRTADFEVKDIIPIVQSISSTLLPWQGIHITTLDMENTKANWDNSLDKRPSLGSFYYDDDNNRRENWLYDGFDDIFNRQLDNCTSPEFTPDADVRMFKTTGISNSLLWKYWDNNIQPDNFQETTAPIEIQVYLYPRIDGGLFDVKDVDEMNYKLGYYYAAYIDWGDGTPIEYNTDEPFELGYNNILKHSYEKAGIYEITGYMLKVGKTEGGKSVMGVCYNQYFTIRININEGDDNEFEYLGGDDYSTIPYKETVPIVGGVSKNSIYYKTLSRQLGYLDTDTTSPSISTDFERTGDRLRVENALATIDEMRIGQLQSTLTGSYYENGTLIYSGSYNNFGELGDSLGDVDIGQIRYFDEPMQMYELLGGNQITGTPDHPEYWQNIIPEDYNLLGREGISIIDDAIEIDEEASQNWNGGYYYPILPKLDRYGKFVDTILKPPLIPAMDKSYMTGSLLINIEPEYIDSNILSDSAGGENVGAVIGDYKVNFDLKTREPKKEKNISNIRIGRKDKAY